MLYHPGLGLSDPIVKGKDVPAFSAISHSAIGIGGTILLGVILFIGIVTRSYNSNGPNGSIQVRMELSQAVVRFDDLVAVQLGLVATGVLDHGPVRLDGPNVALALLLLFLLRLLCYLLLLLLLLLRLDEKGQLSTVGSQPPIQRAQSIAVVIGVVLSLVLVLLGLTTDIAISNGTMRCLPPLRLPLDQPPPQPNHLLPSPGILPPQLPQVGRGRCVGGGFGGFCVGGLVTSRAGISRPLHGLAGIRVRAAAASAASRRLIRRPPGRLRGHYGLRVRRPTSYSIVRCCSGRQIRDTSTSCAMIHARSSIFAYLLVGRYQSPIF